VFSNVPVKWNSREGIMDKQAFIDAKPQVKDVPVPQWGSTVYVKKFSAAERIEFLRLVNQAAEDEDASAKNITNMVKLLLLCISDENGNRIFDNSEEDYNILAAKDDDILDKIMDEALVLNGIGADSEKEAIKN
jgi:hypothetical protein